MYTIFNIYIREKTINDNILLIAKKTIKYINILSLQELELYVINTIDIYGSNRELEDLIYNIRFSIYESTCYSFSYIDQQIYSYLEKKLFDTLYVNIYQNLNIMSLEEATKFAIEANLLNSIGKELFYEIYTKLLQHILPIHFDDFSNHPLLKDIDKSLVDEIYNKVIIKNHSMKIELSKEYAKKDLMALRPIFNELIERGIVTEEVEIEDSDNIIILDNTLSKLLKLDFCDYNFQLGIERILSLKSRKNHIFKLLKKLDMLYIAYDNEQVFFVDLYNLIYRISLFSAKFDSFKGNLHAMKDILRMNACAEYSNMFKEFANLDYAISRNRIINYIISAYQMYDFNELFKLVSYILNKKTKDLDPKQKKFNTTKTDYNLLKTPYSIQYKDSTYHVKHFYHKSDNNILQCIY